MNYLSRNEIISNAILDFTKDCYKHAQPSVTWDEFLQQNREYIESGEKGPRPYEFYYLPEKVFKELQEMYIDAYRIAPEFEDDCDTILQYLEKPVRHKWIEKGTDLLSNHSGYRGFEYYTPLKEEIGEEAYNKVVEYIKEASEFYNKNHYYNGFLMQTSLGPTPSSNKENVIKNWKEFRDTDITINESIYNGDDYDDWEGEIE